MKIKISHNPFTEPWSVSELIRDKSKSDYAIIHNNKIIRMKYVNDSINKKIESSEIVDFDLRRFKNGYVIYTTMNNSDIKLNAYINYFKFVRIKFNQGKYPTEIININVIIYSLISGIIGFIISSLIDLIHCK